MDAVNPLLMSSEVIGVREKRIQRKQSNRGRRLAVATSEGIPTNKKKKEKV